MDIGIAGAGAIGMGYAAFLIENGHTPHVWSPTGERTLPLHSNEPIVITGAIEGQFHPTPCKNAEILAKNDVIILALPAYGHRFVLDELIPYLEPRHHLILSGHLSFAALYVSKELAKRGIRIPITAWNTTALTAKATDKATDIYVGTLRQTVDIAVIPNEYAQSELTLCNDLFGNRFRVVDDLLSIALSNLNPQNHLAMVLGNFTRMEIGEEWHQNTYVTPSVGRLMQALDQERVSIANAFGKSVSNLAKKMERVLDRSFNSISEAYQIQVDRGSNPLGPKTTETRYVLEDVPFGLTPTVWLAKLAEIPAPLHRSGIEILNGLYDRKFDSENDLLPEIGKLTKEELTDLATNGYEVGDVSPSSD